MGENMREIIIDGESVNKNENMRYRGAGMVSGNNSSRLLLDYKAENPKAYWEILEHTFGENGIGVNHLKLEMGSDINSSSGTEPSVMRSEEEKADVTRGAGYQLAADAKSVNPDLTLDMLWWGEPKWVSSSENVCAARYKWYKNTLDAAYEVYGLKFDYVSAVRNERAADLEWVKYLSSRLKSETDCPYDYSKIKIVGGEEVCTWGFADRMLEDGALMDSVDVVGSHYTSSSTPAAQELALKKGKELWLSEASSPMSYAEGAYRYDGAGSGLSGINGALDIANRIIGMYPNGKMTLYEYQPVISAYYDGACYCQKQLILACDPWSGFYMLDSGFYISLHFSRFIKKGWEFVDSGCYSDGKVGGDGHAIVDAVFSYMTAADPKTGDYSTVIANTTNEPIAYTFRISGLDKASAEAGVWETRGPDKISGSYDENYFKPVLKIKPEEAKEESKKIYTYKITVKPYSIITVSTLIPQEKEFLSGDIPERTVLKLPYYDDFKYSEFPESYLASRGFAPRYTTDQGGAFEVEAFPDGNYLVQQITPGEKAEEWGWTPDPVTTLGDDRWYNYSVTSKVIFEPSEKPSENYIGVGLRYILAADAYSGYWIKLCEDGSWKLNSNGSSIASGKIKDFDGKKPHTVKAEAFGNTVRAYVDGSKAAEYMANESVIGAGRAALYSSYNKNRFAHILIEPMGDDPYITRYDDTDSRFEYSGDWEHDTMSGFKNYKRTISKGKKGCSFKVCFDGKGVGIFGETEGGAVLSVETDGDEPIIRKIPKAGSREISLLVDGLENLHHTLKASVIEGEYAVDGAQVMGGSVPLSK